MINLENVTIRLDGRPALKSVDMAIASGDCSVIFGGDGVGKSALLNCLCDPGLVSGGTYSNSALRVGVVSLREQERLILSEEARDDSDLTDQIFSGTPVLDLLKEASPDGDLLAHLIEFWT